jgi:restriction system protein
MLEQLSSREFEEYCQVLLMCLYKCRVDLTPQTGDEGRDLLVRLSAGLKVAECKHWPNGTVGRPVVQKLHSATRTAGAREAMIITTGRFSHAAEVYARQLPDVRIELVDAVKLAHLIATTLPGGRVAPNLTMAAATTSDNEFPQAFAGSVFAEPRYRSALHQRVDVQVHRRTRYAPFYVACFTGHGALNTAAGRVSKDWEGRVWLRADGQDAGFGFPPYRSAGGGAYTQLQRVLQAVPGHTTAPKLQPHEAWAQMKSFVVENCRHSIFYYGRNNQSYARTVTPTAGTVQPHGLRVVYVPRQTFVLHIGNAGHKGEVDEQASPPRFYVTCPSLSRCTVCGTATAAAKQVLCAVCFMPAHRWSILCPDSFRCVKCGALVCRHHAVRSGWRRVCRRCAPDGRSLWPRWLGHLLCGMITTTGAGLAELVEPGQFLMGMVAVALVGWLPLLGLLGRPLVARKSRLLIYPKRESTR